MSQVSKIVLSLNDDVWVKEAIDSIRFLGDVGQTGLDFLELILPHCTVDQLMHVEKCSKGRDLSPVTDKLWKNFYERTFGKDDTNSIIERMQCKKESFRWKQLYEAKMKELEKKARESEYRLIQNYQKEQARKQSRQIQFCHVPSSSNKNQNFEGTTKFGCAAIKSKMVKAKREVQICEAPSSTNKKRPCEKTTGFGYNTNKSKLLKKAKREALQSLETKNLIAFRRNAIQRS